MSDHNYEFHKNNETDTIYWVNKTDSVGEHLFTFDKEKIYNLFEPYENSHKDTILCANNGISFTNYLENRIKELKGEE